MLYVTALIPHHAVCLPPAPKTTQFPPTKKTQFPPKQRNSRQNNAIPAKTTQFPPKQRNSRQNNAILPKQRNSASHLLLLAQAWTSSTWA
jgi:hypothetical protein